ncbi:MAG: AlpA family phage regulatory protein [Syntrophaceae bacterium]|nr:AlpA family phage regulatory protein [Syntrophaceae bacterium]
MTSEHQRQIDSFEERNQKFSDERLLRLNQIVGDKNNPPLIPVSKSTWWAKVRAGVFPAPIHLGKRITVWRKSDIDALIRRLSEGVKNDTSRN